MVNPHTISPAYNFITGIGNWLQKMNANLFFLFIFLYHVLVIFQGLDFNDEGFHLAFYQQIFNDPESVQFGFWMWLTGIISGIYLKIFPFVGMWGIRLLGAAFSTFTIIIAYNLLKRYLHTGYLRMSMIMLSLFINEDAKNLYYNNFSAFFYFLNAYLLFTGIRDNRKFLIFWGGFFVCLNIFTRIPNVLGLGLGLGFFYYAWLKKSDFKVLLTQIGLFVIGFILSGVIVFTAMKLLGHLPYFVESIKLLFSSSQSSAKNDGIGGAYGIYRLLSRNLIDYALSLRAAVLAGGFLFLVALINSSAVSASRSIRTAVSILNYLLLAGMLLLVLNGWFDSYRLRVLFTGISLFSLMILFNKNKSPDYKLLALFGAFIFLIHPFGSSEGISTVVVYSLWLSFPIAIDSIAKIRWVNMDMRMGALTKESGLKISISENQLRPLRLGSIAVIILACLFNVIMYPYLCDRHSRLEMFYSVSNKYTKAVYTSKGRAASLNELLLASSKYVKRDDYVLAYDCMPLYHFMTETKSYVRNPCIWFYSNELFLTELKRAENSQKKLPVVVKQNILTTGEGSAWPEITPKEDYSLLKRNLEKNQYLSDFLKRNNYQEVWTNGHFIIFIPPGPIELPGK